MLPPARASLPRVARGIAVYGVALAALAASFLLGSAKPGGAPAVTNDKVMHFVGYAVMAVVSYPAARDLAGRYRVRASVLDLVYCILAGAGLELWQTQLPHRQGDWADLLADAMGAGLVAICARVWEQRGH